MNYSDASAFVCAYITPAKQLYLMTDKGQRVRHPETDPQTQRDILEEFELKWRFASLESDLVFNPSFITKIHYDKTRKNIVLAGSKREWMRSLSMSPDVAKKRLQRVEGEGYIPWPENKLFHREYVRSMEYNEDRQCLIMQDQTLRSHEANISYEEATYYLRAFMPEAFDKKSGALTVSDPKAEPDDEPDDIPRRTLDKQTLRTLPSQLKSNVVGQDPAADAMVKSIYHNAAGLGEPNKPIGSFLFLGPTGVGKTEMAKQLANILNLPFKKLDMSEYHESHNVARLIGSPPGYKDSERGGDLTNFVRKANGPCVVLLDEIEKAHPDVPKILLQVFDDARLTDGLNNTVECQDVIFIMTSNLGSGPQQKKPNTIGFTKAAEPEKEDYNPRKDPAVRSYFSMEFLNRVDSIIRFDALKPEHMELITKILLKKLVHKDGMKDVRFSISPDAEKYLAEKGLDPEFGARPLKRLIAEEIEQKLAAELLFGALENGGSLSVCLNDDKTGLNLAFSAAANDNKPKLVPAPVTATAAPKAALLRARTP